MICTEYFPAYTHSDNPDCDNCKYKGILHCTNVRVLHWKKQRQEFKEKLKNYDTNRTDTPRD